MANFILGLCGDSHTSPGNFCYCSRKTANSLQNTFCSFLSLGLCLAINRFLDCTNIMACKITTKQEARQGTPADVVADVALRLS